MNDSFVPTLSRVGAGPVRRVVIIGAGAGGATVAALLSRRDPALEVTVIEPSETHWYQPAWTLVGAGAFDIARTARPTKDCLPSRVRRIAERAVRICPDSRQVTLAGGTHVEYDALVVAAGIHLAWDRIDGLTETLGRNSVSSNYRSDLAPYTWECLRTFQGGSALFTQPAMPIKCAGAPQKILYMAADRFRQRRLNAALSFFTPGPTMFGVPFYAQALDRVVSHYGIQANFGHALVAVDGRRRRAVFETKQGDRAVRKEVAYDFLHVVPPQSAPPFIQDSGIADGAGWLAVDKHTLQHVQHPTIFGLGDCTTTPNSKTAAAVRAQAPVVVDNLLSALRAAPLEARYDGYASCPLTTSMDRIMLAEFVYDGVVAPSFPLDPRVPRRVYWHLKKSFLPGLYWRMIGGRLGPDWHARREFPEALPAIRP